MKILITGGTGFIGTVLCRKLLEAEHEIVVVTRNVRPLSGSLKGIENLSQLADDESFDAVINLAGEPIADKRWSSLQKEKIIRSRLDITQELIDYFERIVRKPQVFISGSAIGYYGIKANTSDTVNEQSPGDDSFSSQLCQQWEKVAAKAETMGIRTCLLRTGIVLGEGGALKKMLPAFKLGLGGKIGSGKQWMPWIHIDDMTNIILHAIANTNINGAINCTAPNSVTNSGFTQALGKVLKRPAIFIIPSLMINCLMGEMGKELLLSGKNVYPMKLMESDYPFKFQYLDAALDDILQKD